MDAVLLSRIQFALTIGFHYLFPPITIGMTLVIFLSEFKFYRSKDEIYKKVSSFLIKILGLVFAVGVATGIVMEFSFGTNWSNYSRMVGDIFGAPLAAEAIFAFFLESSFLGILLFAREKVSSRVYLLSAFLVMFGSHLSGLWIIIANSWMQTPAGFQMVEGKAVLTNFFEAALNPSTVERYIHTIVGAWIAGSAFAAGIGAWFIIKKRDLDFAKILVKISLIVFILASFLQFGTGHMHAIQVAKTQPVKMAAFEALWETQKGAPMSIIGIPDAEAKKTHFEIAIPKLLSFMIDFDPNSEVKGLNDYPDDVKPPILLTYFSYHMMIGLGSLFALIALIGGYLMFKDKLYDTKWYLYLLMFSIPLPLLSNEVGWVAAEVGRQPWVVYNVLRTSNAVSVVVPAWQILFSIIIFSLIYLLLGLVFIKLLIKIIKKGPGDLKQGY